jgi:TonB-linked SusC/RagA family outer membrane protein
VLDVAGVELIGVSIYPKSSPSLGVTSDANGAYSISAKKGDILIFSYLGYENYQVQVASARSLDIVLKEKSEFLNEVVVTSLNIPREKKALGYAIQNVSGDVLETRPSNAMGALSGRIAGLQIISSGGNMGGSSRVVLRGVTSVLGNNQPLYVIDGVPVDDTDMNSSSTVNGSAGKNIGSVIQDINPDDIADITVLKGPSAAALYGSRAANGVVMVTTKKGDNNNNRLDIQANLGLEFEKVVRLPKRQKLYGGGYSQTFKTQVINGKEYKLVDYAADESWGPRLDGTPVLHWYNLDPEYAGDYLNAEPWVYPENDVMSFFKTGISNTNNISLAKSTKNANFRLSYTNKNVKGTIPNSSMARNTVNVSGNIKNDLVNVFASINYVNSKSDGRPWTGASNRNIILEAYQWGQVQVDYKKLSEYKRASDGTPRAWNRSSWENTEGGKKTKYIDNPYWSAYESYLEDDRERVYGNIGVTLTPTKWLSLTGRVNGDIYSYNSQDRIAKYSRSQSMYQEYSNKFDEFNYEFLASANKRWDKHSLVVNLGANQMEQKRRISDIQTAGGLEIANYYSLNNSLSLVISPETGYYQKAISSIYGSASYGFNSLVYVDATIRNDWSSTLPTDNNSYLYPSVTTSLILSELAFAKQQDWLSFAKLRLGWAQVGNDTDPYRLYNVFVPNTPFANGITNSTISHTRPNLLNNDQLKPEITSSWEAGLQLQLFNNVLGVDFTYYNNNSRNQIIDLPVSDAFGYSKRVTNAGKINNQGVEVSLKANIIDQKDWKWNSTFNFSHNRNKIVSLTEDVKSLELSGSLISLVAKEGESYGQLMGTNFVYTPDGQKVVNSEGVYMKTEQLEPLGSVMPDFLLGFQNQINYKNFSFGFLIDTRVGGHFFSQTYKVGMYAGVLESTAANNIRETGIVVDGVKAEVQFNPDGTYNVSNIQANETNISAQKWARNHYDGPDAFDIFDASFVKLRELTLGYSFALPKYKLERINLTFYARNLWNIYSASKYIEPELTNSGGNVQGIEGGNMPTPLTFGFNLGLKF